MTKKMIYELRKTNQVVHHYLTAHDIHGISLEDVLFGMVYVLAEDNERLRKIHGDHLMICGSPIAFTMPNRKL